MVDFGIFSTYGLIIIISFSLFALIFVLGHLIATISTINSERSHRYLSNIIISIFGGIIAVILIEVKEQDFTSLGFYTITLPLTLLIILIFVLFGIWYLYIMDKMFNQVKNEVDKKKR